MTDEKVVLDGADMRRTLVRIAHEIVEKQIEPQELAIVGIHRRGAILARRLRTLLDEHRLAVTKRLERAQGRLDGTMPDAYTDALVGLIDMEDIEQ